MSDVLDILAMRPIYPYWPKPWHRHFAAIGGNVSVYREVLEIAGSDSNITAEKLLSPEQGLRNRLRKLVLIQTPSKTNVRAMLSLLERFGWLSTDERARYNITALGNLVLAEASKDARNFKRRFAVHLDECYVVPGWLVARLHELNPGGQGEIILPAPPKLLGLGRRKWGDKKWPDELDEIVVEAGKHANAVIPGAFPISIDKWRMKIVEIWDRLGSGAPPVSRFAPAGGNTFAVRERLFHAMREASIELLFGRVNPVNSIDDFNSGPQPISYRAFSVWCPRLSEIEFIFYTDYHPRIAGRLIVPCGAFRNKAPSSAFEEMPNIRDLRGRSLFLYQPDWNSAKTLFLKELLAIYRDESRKAGVFYTSLLVVRDEVCRRMRLSAALFDKLLESAYENAVREMTMNGKQFSISLESDIRPDQRSAIGLNQRPIYIHRVPHSLIAISTNRIVKK